MRARALLLAPLLIPSALQAQSIRGIVFEYGTRNTIAGAAVEVVDRKGLVTAATSDSMGYFIIYPRTAGRMTVHATHPSFTAVRTDTVTAAQKEMVTVFVRMTNSPIAIAPIVVTARSRTALNGFYERQRRNAFGRYITEKEIERKRPVSVEQLMRGVVGVQVAEGDSELTLRGNDIAPCSANIFVDGLPMPQGRDVDLDLVVPIGQLAAVEIYPDATGVPFEFMNAGNQCGSVVFWTRPIRNARPITWKRAGIAAAIVGAVVLVETVFMRTQEADTSDKPMRGSPEWQDAGRWRPTVRIQVPLPSF